MSRESRRCSVRNRVDLRRRRNFYKTILRIEMLESRRLLALVPLTISIPRFVEIDDPDPDFIFTDIGDYYPVVKIGNNPEETRDEVSSRDFSPNWTFTQLVEQGDNPIPVEIKMFDEDDFLRFNDDQIDINPNPGRNTLKIWVDITTGGFSGDVSFPVNSIRGNPGNDDDGERGQLFFEVDSDSDGLNDRWERLGIDSNNDGTIDLTLPGASPVRKDLYVEVDAMAGRAPVAIPPIINILPTTPITVTSNSHGLSTGTRVSLTGITGTGAIGALNNNTFSVTRASNNTFTLDGTTGGGNYTNGGVWSLANLTGTGLATNTSIDLTIDAFLRAPIFNTNNSFGIRLHVLLDELALPRVSWNNDADGDGNSPLGEDLNANGVLDVGEDGNGNNVLDNGDADDQGGATMYNRLRNSNFGTPAERGNPAAMAAKALAYRYGPFVDIKVDSNGNNQGVTTGSSGMAYSASSFMVSMGAWNTPGGLNDQQAGTFMHELGHTLGLGHGGGDGVNNKPNYYSLMNYTWQVPEGGNVNMQASWRMDYSIGNFPALNENSLNEPAGIAGIAGRFVRIGPNIPPPAGSPPGTGPSTRVVTQTGAVDWNNNGNSTGVGVSADANYDNTTGTTLNDYNDWANLKYSIQTAQSGFSKPDDIHFTYEQYLDQTETLEFQAPTGNGADNFTLRRSGDYIEIVSDGGAVLARRLSAETTFIAITGANFEDDRLTIAFGGGNPIPSGGVSYDGGGGANDTLALTGTPPGTPDYVPSPPAGPGDGRLIMGGSHVNFTGLEFVRPVAPEITSFTLGPTTIDENGVVSLSGSFEDPGSLSTHSITINWGDGSVEGPVPIATSGRTFSASHRYRDDNPSVTPADTYNVTFTLTDNDSLSAVRMSTVQVNNVRPLLQNVAVTPEIDENGVVTLSGAILDPGTLDTFTLVVNWGEGVPQTFTYPAGTTNFSETHQYLDDNPTATPQDVYSITLNLSDDDSGTDAAARATLVKNVAPMVTAFTSDAVECGDKAEGDTVHVTGSFVDVGTKDTHTATIAWGDGATTTAMIVEAGGAGTIASEHIYASGGIFRIVVTLTDDDTGQTTARTFALITGVGILDGQLQVVGTKQADDVHINWTGRGTITAHASFIGDSPRSLPAAGLTSIAMILCEGDDTATIASNIYLPTYIDAGDGNDDLNGGGGPNILLGGTGNDHIKGGMRHDILVGGIGTDRIVGNGGDDILIAGTLGGAEDPIDQLDALLALLVDWDLNRNRTLLRPKMIISGDSDADKLTGSSGADWFFFELGEDTATDLKTELSENLG